MPLIDNRSQGMSRRETGNTYSSMDRKVEVARETTEVSTERPCRKRKNASVVVEKRYCVVLARGPRRRKICSRVLNERTRFIERIVLARLLKTHSGARIEVG